MVPDRGKGWVGERMKSVISQCSVVYWSSSKNRVLKK